MEKNCFICKKKYIVHDYYFLLNEKDRLCSKCFIKKYATKAQTGVHIFPFPNKKYKIIYADPPWCIDNGVYKTKYNTMSTDEIAEMSIPSDENSALFLWVLNSRIDDGLYVMKKWGYEYKTVAFCWVKTAKNTGMPNCRVGSYTLGGIELCLLGIKNKMVKHKNNVRQVVMHPRGIHSKKPDVIRDMIVELYGDLPRIELFARNTTAGWDVWGNEVGDNSTQQRLYAAGAQSAEADCV